MPDKFKINNKELNVTQLRIDDNIRPGDLMYAVDPLSSPKMIIPTKSMRTWEVKFIVLSENLEQFKLDMVAGNKLNLEFADGDYKISSKVILKSLDVEVNTDHPNLWEGNAIFEEIEGTFERPKTTTEKYFEEQQIPMSDEMKEAIEKAKDAGMNIQEFITLWNKTHPKKEIEDVVKTSTLSHKCPYCSAIQSPKILNDGVKDFYQCSLCRSQYTKVNVDIADHLDSFVWQQEILQNLVSKKKRIERMFRHESGP